VSVVVDPHITGSCVIVLDEDGACVLRDAFIVPGQKGIPASRRALSHHFCGGSRTSSAGRACHLLAQQCPMISACSDDHDAVSPW
jgi:hypothetical protein